MSHEQQQRIKEQLGVESERAAREQASAVASQMSGSTFEEHIKNPSFLEKLQDADLDGDLYDWLEDEFGPLTSGTHIIGNRSRSYEREAKWLNQNRAERLISEARPGRLLRDNPAMLAIAQGVHDTEKDPIPPKTSDERRVTRDAMEVVTNLMSLAAENRGLESVTTATAEHRAVRTEEEDTSRTRARLRKVFD